MAYCRVLKVEVRLLQKPATVMWNCCPLNMTIPVLMSVCEMDGKNQRNALKHKEKVQHSEFQNQSSEALGVVQAWLQGAQVRQEYLGLRAPLDSKQQCF